MARQDDAETTNGGSGGGSAVERSSGNARFAATAFLDGANAAYIEQLHERYRENPGSVDQEWQDFFGALNDDPAAVEQSASGPAWKKASWPVVANGELVSALDGNWPAVEKAMSAKIVAEAAKGTVPAAGADAASPEVAAQATRDSVRMLMMIRAYRTRGHLHAKLDPLGLAPPKDQEELHPSSYGFTEADWDRRIFLDGVLGLKWGTIREIMPLLRRTYCDTIGYEFIHMSDPAEKGWMQARVEGPDKAITFTPEGKRAILNKLIEAEGFEKFLDVKYTGTKRFGLDGGESMVPALEQIIKRGGALGVEDIELGMAHRGRLNVLSQVMAKPHRAIFHEFKGGSYTPVEMEGSGDVKYHLGFSSDRTFDDRRVHLSLAANPSHLEIVDPVVLGKVRAKQDQKDDLVERAKVLPLLLHGDAAFAGQGVIAECFGLSGLKGHNTGGSIHFIINNQIGFTTYPRYSRSSPYPSDVAKMIEAPILHVNGDDPEAVTHAAKIAVEFRQRFHKPVVIDMFCYRRFGHNEGDEPSFTQPLMYKKIRKHRSVLDLYAEKLVAEGVITAERVEQDKAAWRAKLEIEFEAGQNYKPNKADWLDGRWAGLHAATGADDALRGKTGVERSRLVELGHRLTEVPKTFHLHKTIQRLLDNRRKAVDTGQNIDWAMGESLALATLLDEGFRVRLSGQDSERGTFSQRHSVLIDQDTEARFIPLNHVRDEQGRFEVINSMLSEEAVLGFEYGYSVAEPDALVLWEAQFGDFANGAQVVFDQFISSAERKWLRLSGLVCLLPHGYEGQGPEHSSATARALPAALRRGQHAGRQLLHAGQLLPRPASAAEARHPQAADPDDAEVAAAPQACRVEPGRHGGWDELPPHPARRRRARRRAQGEARRRRQDPPRAAVLGQGLLRPLRGAREARDRRRLHPARRAALPDAAQGAGQRAVAFRQRPDRLGPGGAQEHGCLDLHRPLSRMGADAGELRPDPAALHRPSGRGRDGDGPDVETPGADEGFHRRGVRLGRPSATRDGRPPRRRGLIWQPRSAYRPWARASARRRSGAGSRRLATRSRPTSRSSSSRPTR